MITRKRKVYANKHPNPSSALVNEVIERVGLARGIEPDLIRSVNKTPPVAKAPACSLARAERAGLLRVRHRAGLGVRHINSSGGLHAAHGPKRECHSAIRRRPCRRFGSRLDGLGAGACAPGKAGESMTSPMPTTIHILGMFLWSNRARNLRLANQMGKIAA
jgi:hypothetical protein